MNKKDFPIFKHHPELVYLDSTATSLKPKVVVDKLNEYYLQYSSNIHRGVYAIAEKASFEYEDAREQIASFINANSKEEVIFTKGTTEALNTVAYSLAHDLHAGDEVIVTSSEHHANFVPWQEMCKAKDALFTVYPVGLKDILDTVPISKKTKIIALPYISNVLGIINPVAAIIKEIKKKNPNILVVVDGAQAAPHIALDVQALGCDFLAFSGHKMLGPTGIGVLWGKKKLLDSMHPFEFGGDMIEAVYTNRSVYKPSPGRFEAGTPPIAEAIALKAAASYLLSVGLEEIHKHEAMLTAYALTSLKHVFGKSFALVGSDKPNRVGIVAFNVNPHHPHDIAQILDENHIAVRAGHHCAMPLHTELGLPASVRASFYLYNEKSDIDKLVVGLEKVKKIFG